MSEELRAACAVARAVPAEAANNEISGALAALPADATSDQFVAALAALPTVGPFIQQVIALIKQGLANLPAILAALQALGIVLPPWATVIIQLLLLIVPKPAPTPVPAPTPAPTA